MIQTIKGDLLIRRRGMLVHGCNSIGVMSAGIAAQVREKWPDNYQSYREHCGRHGKLALGTIPYTVLRRDEHDNPVLVIVNAITQLGTSRGGERVVSYDAVAECFTEIGKLAAQWKLPVLFPRIGAGLGGGNWDIIDPIIDESLPPNVERTCYVL